MFNTQQLAHNSLMALLVALLTFFGAAGGTLVTSRVDRSKEERASKREYEQLILKTRMELVERTLNVINSGPVAKLLYAQGDATTAHAREILAADPNHVPPEAEKLIEEAANKSRELNKLSTDWATVLALDEVFFGPGTKSAVVTVRKANPWWDTTQDVMHLLLESVTSEIWYHISKPGN